MSKLNDERNKRNKNTITFKKEKMRDRKKGKKRQKE